MADVSTTTRRNLRLHLAAATVTVLTLAGCASTDTTDNSAANNTTAPAGATGGSGGSDTLTTKVLSSWGDLSKCKIGPQTTNPTATPAPEKINGVMRFPEVERRHADGCLDYPVRPAVAGVHHPVWANCGFYTSPVPEEAVVHVLEHGGVSVSMDPSISQADIATIRKAVTATTHMIASPYPGLKSKLVLSAWNRQLDLDSASDPRFAKFIETFLEGPNTPEPGATCSGGLGAPS